MMKPVVAAFLAGVSFSMPANAIVPFEIIGTADIYTTDQIARTTTFIGTRSFHAIGDLAVGGRWTGTMPGQFTYSALYGHYTSWDIGFSFLPYVDDPYDGLFHAATGGGRYLSGYLTFDAAYLTITSARVWQDASTPAAIFPTISFGAPVPEPASWAMMIGGLALIGGLMRRQQQHSPQLALC